MTYVQDPPNAIQMEATEGCNLRCGFCGIRGITEKGPDGGSIAPDGALHFMTPEIAGKVGADAMELGWNPRVEWAMHGEPTLNPELPRLVETMKSYLPRQPFMLTTNGIPLLDDFDGRIRELFAVGFDTIAIDNYRPFRCEDAFDRFAAPGIRKHRYPEEKAGNPHRRPKTGEKRLVLVEDIVAAAEGNHATLWNHAGCAYPKDPNASGRCAKPFRELSVRWDGNVAICCDDWRGEFKVGNVLHRHLDEIWQDEHLMAARRMLYAGLRTAGPCEGCTHKTYRNGLLPNRGGRDELPPPTGADFALIGEATAGASYAVPVLRRWEKVEIST